jgi:hypothetical protein
MIGGYNFSEHVRRALMHARREANRLGHAAVSPEHVLLGVLETSDALPAPVVLALGDHDSLAAAVEQRAGRGELPPDEDVDLPYTSRAKLVLERTMEEAKRLESGSVGLEELLLGLLAERKGIPALLLGERGVTLDSMRDVVVASRASSPAGSPSGRPSRQRDGGAAASPAATVEESGPRRRPAFGMTTAALLVVGALLGMLGSFESSPMVRGVAWTIDGVALVAASALLAIDSLRRGRDLLAAGFLVFLAGETLVVSASAMDLAASAPFFSAGAGLWAAGLLLVSMPRGLPGVVRATGVVAAILLAVSSLRIASGAGLTPLSRPLPFGAYPFLAVTLFGWAWVQVRTSAVRMGDV